MALELAQELLACARYGENQEVEEILNQVQDKRELILTQIDGNTSVHMAAANGHLPVLKLLCEHLLNGDVNIQNNEQNTPLHWASLNGHLECVKLLLAKGATATLRNASGKSSVTLAGQADHEEVMTELLMSFEEDEESDVEEGEANNEQEQER